MFGLIFFLNQLYFCLEILTFWKLYLQCNSCIKIKNSLWSNKIPKTLLKVITLANFKLSIIGIV